MKQKMLNLGLVLVPLLLFATWIFTSWTLHYQVHDDRYMMEFVSGKFLGHGDAHLVYINYGIGLILLALYQICKGVDWYGVCMYLFQFWAMGVFSYYCIRKQKNWKRKGIVLLAFYLIFILCWIVEVTSFTYTTVSALLGVTALFTFAVGDNCWKDYIVTILASAFCMMLRVDIFMMLVPVCGIIWIWKFIASKEKKMVYFLIALGTVLVFCYGVNQIAYQSPKWNAYMKYNQERTSFFDYDFEDKISYQEQKAVYDQLGISEAEVKGLESYNLAFYDNQLYDYMEDLAKAPWVSSNTGIRRMAKEVPILMGWLLHSSKMLVLFTLFIHVVCLVYLILHKQKGLGIVYVASVIVYGFLWGYICYKGRFLDRVNHSLLLQQIVTQVALLFMVKPREIPFLQKKYQKRLLLCMGVGVCGILFLLGARICIKMHGINEKEGSYRDHYLMEEYCAKDEDKFFFLDVRSVTECKYIFSFKNDNAYENFISLGDWYGNSPYYTEKMEEEGITSVQDAVLHDKSVYIIAKKDTDFSYMQDLTTEKLTIKEVDEITGGYDEYGVYQVLANAQ